MGIQIAPPLGSQMTETARDIKFIVNYAPLCRGVFFVRIQASLRLRRTV